MFLNQSPSLSARYWWDEHRKDEPPKHGENVLTLTLTLMVQGRCRIRSEEEYQYRISRYKLSEGN